MWLGAKQKTWQGEITWRLVNNVKPTVSWGAGQSVNSTARKCVRKRFSCVARKTNRNTTNFEIKLDDLFLKLSIYGKLFNSTPNLREFVIINAKLTSFGRKELRNYKHNSETKSRQTLACGLQIDCIQHLKNTSWQHLAVSIQINNY